MGYLLSVQTGGKVRSLCGLKRTGISEMFHKVDGLYEKVDEVDQPRSSKSRLSNLK